MTHVGAINLKIKLKMGINSVLGVNQNLSISSPNFIKCLDSIYCSVSSRVYLQILLCNCLHNLQTSNCSICNTHIHMGIQRRYMSVVYWHQLISLQEYTLTSQHAVPPTCISKHSGISLFIFRIIHYFLYSSQGK